MNVLMLRPGGALGDSCFVNPIPRLLAEQGHKVTVACERAAKPIFANNPYISKFVTVPQQNGHPAVWQRWKPTLDRIMAKHDMTYHVHSHVEVNLMYRTDVLWGSIPCATERRKKAEGVSYQDEILKAIGLEHRGVLPEFYFTEKEKKEADNLRQMLTKDGKKLILWQWDGSSQSKILVWGPKYLRETLEMFPDTIHYVYAGDDNLKMQIPRDDRVLSALGKMSVRQSIVLSSIADLVIGPESFLVNAAAAFDTPKIIFFSHSAPENLAKYYRNCYSIQPTKEATCHPCYLIQIDFKRIFDPSRRAPCREFLKNCQVWDPRFRYRSLGSKCCYHLPHEQVMQTVERVMEN